MDRIFPPGKNVVGAQAVPGLKIGVSACLLGNKVRYDGGHKLEPWLLEALGLHVTYVPVCPEVECGLCIPREPMVLVGERDNPRLLTLNTGIDLSKQIWDWVEKRIAELASEGLSGFVFKSKSPSCGLRNVELFPRLGGTCSKNGMGIFAAAFLKAFPQLPVIDEIQLSEPEARENFLRALGLDFSKNR
ncbi:MAG: DUF523 domain-containing protein [Candidatus Cloacimonadaceae bacterium]|jgi:uncharacterized protein YbbK (DUF523 family)|nr:DUF523 domain-containing protein [Candidatus Cloacimonadota bacterium]MDX9949720.1 DUF523 domain-containing protein [Candidatus Syntrophosphaera sp.]